MMQTSPKVSILIPTYNYAHYLDEAIQSVIKQTYKDFELIIIDDHSKDNTDEVIQKYLTDSRVSYFKNKNNLGLVGNWNECLAHARGEYIKFLCADDKFCPLLLEKFVTVMEQFPNVSLVTSYKEQFGSKPGIKELPFKGLHEGKKIILHTLNNYGWLGEPTAVMFRRLNLKIGNFRPDVTWLPDWEMWLRQLSVGDCYIIPEPLALIRNHAGQLTKKVIKNFLNYFEEYELCKAIKEHNGYSIAVSENEMKKVIRMRAANCAKAMYKVIPDLWKKEAQSIFKKAFKIAFAERVLFAPFTDYVKNGANKLVHS
ncbi:MAG: glycosyltransferase family A protein [Parafilimonas sp.]